MDELRPGSLDEPAEAGFTLVEALVAIALTALLLSALSAAIHLGLRVWKASDTVDRQADTQAAADFLRRTLAGTEPVRIRGKDGKLTSTFKGDSQRIELVALIPEGAFKAGAYRMVLHLIPEIGALNSQTVAVRTDSLSGGDRALTSGGQTTALMTGIAALDIRYFGKIAPLDDAKWHQSWAEVDALPSLIRFEVITNEGGLKRRLIWVIELKLS
jgi:hypothetical protein